MDSPQEGYLLIVVVIFIMIVFLAALLLLMLAYRKRRWEHAREVEIMREKYEKEILQTQVEIQKETMEQIGQDIHDNVGQKLTLAMLYTEHLNLGVAGPAQTEKLSSISGLISESLQDLRLLSQDLTRPGEIRARLEAGLEKEVKQVNASGSCQAACTCSGTAFELPIGIHNMLLRIAQEFLQNSLKHAACSQIEIQTNYEESGIRLLLEDNGKGFQYRPEDGRTGIGISNMQKRAEIIGASLTLTSVPGQGTRLQVFVPNDKLL